jgi:DNA polymerase III subunit beta
MSSMSNRDWSSDVCSSDLMNNKISFSINRMGLFDALDRISQISNKETHKILLILKDNNLKICTEDIVIGSGEENMAIEYSNEEVKFSLNYLFIQDVLSVIKSGNVIFELNNDRSIITVKEENNQDFIYIMMPINN